MSGRSQKVRLKAHLWNHLDGMASGMGTNPDALLARAVTTLLHLHGYAVAPAPAVKNTEPGVPPFNPGVALGTGNQPQLPLITGEISGRQPTIQAGRVAGIASTQPPTANQRAP